MKINKNIRASISYRTRELQKLLHSSELDFFAKVRALIRFLEVTWHPTIGLCPAKIPRQQHRAAESMTSEGDGVLLPASVDQYANSICIGN